MTTHRFLFSLALAAGVITAPAAEVTVSDDSSSALRSGSLKDQMRDSIRHSHKVIYIDGKPDRLSQSHIDSIQEIINRYYYDQFESFSDPAAPYFLFMSKDAQLSMGVGGCVRMRGWYEWGGIVPSNALYPYLIPMNPQPGQMRKFGTTPAGTTLFFKVLGRNRHLGYYQVYIEGSFNGYNNTGFNLKKAYAVLNDWTIGYATSTFSDPASVPPVVDAAGPNNKLSYTSVLVRWMHTMTTRWTVAASLETPSSHSDIIDGITGRVADWLPDAAAFMQYAWGETEHVRLAGIVRTLSYRNVKEGRNHTLPGWGLQLSATGHPHEAVTLYGNVSGGRGYASLSGDLGIGNYDLISDPDMPGKMYTPWASGWNVGLQYHFLPSLFASASWSESHYLNHRDTGPDEYKYGQSLSVNMFWNITPRIQVAMEYDWGRRKNFGGASHSTNRMEMMAQFSF